MIIKALEIRDEGTCLAMLAIKPLPANIEQAAILRRAGFHDFDDYVILIDAHSFEGSYDPYKQCGDTRHHAHLWIRDHFYELRDGDVVDVEFIRGRTPEPKKSEIQPHYGMVA